MRYFYDFAATAAKLLQSCLTLCDPIDGSPPGSPVLGILQARTLEWVAISFSKAWKWKVKVKSLSHVRLLATPWTTAYQAPPSMEFSSKSTRVGCHCLLRLTSVSVKCLNVMTLWRFWNFMMVHQMMPCWILFHMFLPIKFSVLSHSGVFEF